MNHSLLISLFSVVSIKASLSRCSVIGDSVFTPDTIPLDLAPPKSQSFPLVDIVVVVEFIGPVSAKLTGHIPELWREVEIQKLVFNPKAWPHPQTLSHWTRALLILERPNIANGCIMQEGKCYKITKVIEKGERDSQFLSILFFSIKNEIKIWKISFLLSHDGQRNRVCMHRRFEFH